ncbi:MAG: hypothetical protein Q8M03_13325 [Legionella sp.]|nr:hypothetical protein [Legionella sp.]
MKILNVITGTCLLALSSLTFAATASDLTQNWTCTTNASSSDVAADKTADDQMANNKTSADKAFALAAQNCRDCTKITCEMHD